MKKRFKGFTLIELLAVIIILGIILLIAVPMLLNVIEDARVGAYKASVKMIFKDIELLAIKEEFASIYVIDEDLNIVSGNINELGNKDYDNFTGTWEYDQSSKLINLYNVHDGNYRIEFLDNNTADSEWIVIDDKRETYEVSFQLSGSGASLTSNNISVIEGNDITDFPIAITEGYELSEVILNSGSALVNGLEITNVTSDIVITLVVSEIPFACGSDLVDDRDGNIYKTVEIGAQCWFAENLRYTTSECLSAAWTDSAPYDACRVNGGTGWDQDEVSYQWGAAMNGSTIEGTQGMCPTGWHVSTDSEWKELEMYLGMSSIEADNNGWRGTDEGQKIKSIDPAWGGTDTFGFNAKPTGYRETTGTLYSVGSVGFFWTSPVSASSAWRRYLGSSNTNVHRYLNSQAVGTSVRCILGA